MWLLFYFVLPFVLQLLLNVLVGSLHEDLGENMGSLTNVNWTYMRKLVWPTLIISTLIFHPH